MSGIQRPVWEERLFRTLADPERLEKILSGLAEPYKRLEISRVITFEALGFPFGASVARSLHCGLALIRKGQPVDDAAKWVTKTFKGSDKEDRTFRLLKSSIPPGTNVLIVDDALNAGTQLDAAVEILGHLEAKVVAAAFVWCNTKLLNKYKEPGFAPPYPIFCFNDEHPGVLLGS